MNQKDANLNAKFLKYVECYGKKNESDQPTFKTSLASQRLKCLKPGTLSTENTLKILESFYNRFSIFGEEKIANEDADRFENEAEIVENEANEEIDRIENEAKMLKFAGNENADRFENEVETAENEDMDRVENELKTSKEPIENEVNDENEESKEILTPVMVFNKKYANISLTEIFKQLCAEESPIDEIVKLANQFSEAFVDTYNFTPNELSLYEHVNQHAIRMLREDLAKFLPFTSAPQQQSSSQRPPQKRPSILRSSRGSAKLAPKTNSQQSTEDLRKVPMSQFYDENLDVKKCQELNQQIIEKNLPDLCEEELPSILPYPPPAFFVFPNMHMRK